MKRRELIRGVLAGLALSAVPRIAYASSLRDYYESAFRRIVAPVCTNLPMPSVVERDDSAKFWYTRLNLETGQTEVSYGKGMPLPWSDYEAVHESGHAFAMLLGQRYPGRWIRDFLSYHGATITEDDLRIGEIFAEHFAAGLGMTPYLAYPEYKGLVTFRSAEDTRAWIIQANQMAQSVVLVPPINGARYAGESADATEVFWLYPDDSLHTWVNGQCVQ